MRQPVSHLLPLFALLVLLGCAAPEAGDDDTAGAPTLVEVTPEGDPLIDGEPQHPVYLFERLWADDALPAPVIRLPHGVPPLPLGSIDELLAVAANFVSHDPEASFVLIMEEGVEMERVAEAVEWLRRGQAKNLYRLDDTGLHPLPAPS